MPEVSDNAIEDLSYKTWPDLRDMLEGGGRPGVEYCFVLAKNIVKFQQLEEKGKMKWDLLGGVPAFEINGVPFVLMGRGNPIRSARSTAWRAKTFKDVEGVKLVEPQASVKEKPGEAKT